ncbi:MAG: cupredoxin domain-containing protein [Dehalococcoidia bacterium]|nr:cupredoxin domain-containing protein [Dehalococcoidia bacterium]
MSSQTPGHDGHGDSEIHLPDPSIWPLVVGLAALLAGAALIFWSRNQDSDFAGPFVGAALVFVLLSAAGWAWQDSDMRRKAAQGALHAGRDARFTQVLTFAVAEGQLEAARAAGGVLQSVETSDLRSLAGFQDLRIIVSPAATGPSQVLVETTWSGRDELEAYNATRQSLLDVLAAHPDQVVPGSVQAFDMEVVRDTKDTAVRFGLSAAASMFGALLLGGFMVGAGLTAFQEDNGGGGEGVAPTPTQAADPYTVIATDNKFNVANLVAPPNTEVTYTLNNRGQTVHNISFYESEGGAEIVMGPPIKGGESGETTFTTPGVGTYFFVCDFHPEEMTGTLTIQEGAAPPGGAAPAADAGAGGGGAGANTIVATDNKWDKSTLTATAGTEYSITIENKGKIPHNISFYDKKGGKILAEGAEGKIIQGGQSETLTFTVANPGTYYFQCDVHITEMPGTFTVQ